MKTHAIVCECRYGLSRLLRSGRLLDLDKARLPLARGEQRITCKHCLRRVRK